MYRTDVTVTLINGTDVAHRNAYVDESKEASLVICDADTDHMIAEYAADRWTVTRITREALGR